MLSLFLDLQTQARFLAALHNNSIGNWVNANKRLIDTISQLLKEVKVPPGEPKTVELCEFICNSFSSFFQLLCETKEKEKRKVSAKKERFFQKRKLFFGSKTKKFKKRLIDGFLTKNWSDFNSKYKYYFDSVIRFAREQEKLKIQVEGRDGKVYSNFDDAENERNEISSPVVGKTDDDHTPNTSNKLRFRYSTDLLNATPLPDVIPSPSSYLSNKKKVNEKLNKRGMMVQEAQEYENQMKTVMGTMSSPIGKDISKREVNERSKQHKTVTRKISSASITSDDYHFRRDAMNASFQRKLNAQNKKFSEELQKMRDKRERLNREAEEEMRKFRRESALRIQMFLNCIQLKIRWEEQEREWGDWLKHTREPVVKVKTQFMEFDRIRRWEDEEDILSEVAYFHKMVQTAYDKLVYNFRSVDLLSNKYEEKLFLKVIQRKISYVATKLCNLMEELDNFQNTKQFFEKIDCLESEIDSMEIPTTTKLRQICKTVSPREYDIINPPKQPKSYCVITEELS